MATPLIKSDHRGDEPDFGDSLEDHFKAVGVSSVATYKLWCYRNGLKTDLAKTAAEHQAEVELYKRSLVEAREPGVSERHDPRRAEYMTQVFNGEHQNDTLSDVLFRVRAMYNNLSGLPDAQQALGRLLLHVEKYGDLFRPANVNRRYGNVVTNTYMATLEQVAIHHANWIRPIEEWRPESHKPKEQFHSLVRHLLAKYDVPEFFDSAFIQGTTEQARLEQDWFVHIGSGQNIRTARDLPMRVTKRMAHMLMNEGRWGTVPQVFRVVQHFTFGGHWKGRWALQDGPLGEFTDDEPFWETVVQFMANQAFLDESYINPIVDYIRNQKYTPQRILQEDGTEIEGPPPHPSFCMKGRSIAKLLQEVDQWHQDLSGLEDIPLVTWPESGIREFEHEAFDPEIKRQIQWSVHELTTSAQLQVEGRMMSHCVGSYVKRCQSGGESVWSLRALDLDAAEENQVQEHVLTVSVDIRKKLVTQYAGKHNLKPFGKKVVSKKRKASGIYMHLLNQSPTLLKMWMDKEGLSHSSTPR